MDIFQIIIKILTLLGALGLFLFGMRHMSESLQIIAGHRMRNILATVTANRMRGITTGFVVTGAIQSSSASTVMVVSFVNAGLLTLAEATGFIMGANIGTTLTGWLVSIFGFSYDIYMIFLPLIGVGIPLLLARKSRSRSIGEFIVSLAILFIGLQLLKDSVPDLRSNPELLDFLHIFTDMGFISVLIFILIGLILTVMIQSSSATMALTLVMCYNGLISFELAAAMVLGENIGTTITANIASIVANSTGKRAARIHFLFNIIGIIWFLPLFYLFLNGLSKTFEFALGISLVNPEQSEFETIKYAFPLALSAYHTLFNLLNTLLLVSFTPYLIKASGYLVRQKGEGEPVYKLKYITGGFSSVSELSTIQARKMIVTYAGVVRRLFNYIPDLLIEKNDKKYNKLFKKIVKYETITDRIELEIAGYLSKILEGEVSERTSRQILDMFKIIGELESMGDYCFSIAETIRIKNLKKAWFNQEIRDNISNHFNKVDYLINQLINILNSDYPDIPSEDMEATFTWLRNDMEKLENQHYKNLHSKKYPYESGIYYMDIISYCSKISEAAIRIADVIGDSRKT